MTNTNGMIFAEWHSSNRPPLFKGNHYTYWKNRMEIYIQALDYEAWKIIRDGPYISTKIVMRKRSLNLRKNRMNVIHV
jgi:hypothetical protein